MYQQHLVVFADKHDDSSSQLGPNLLSTVLAFLRDIRVEMHQTATDTAVFGVLIPIEQFVAFTSLPVFFRSKSVIALSQSAHLIVLVAEQWLVNAESLFAIYVHYSSPGLGFNRYLGRYPITVSRLFKNKVALTEYEISHACNF
jgi:hypothetical protein